jgi:hypothetical protein
MNPNISIEMFMLLSLPLVEVSQINSTMTLNFDLGNIERVEIPTNPNINIELARFCMYLSHKSRWLYYQK